MKPTFASIPFDRTKLVRDLRYQPFHIFGEDISQAFQVTQFQINNNRILLVKQLPNRDKVNPPPVIQLHPHACLLPHTIPRIRVILLSYLKSRSFPLFLEPPHP
jgi:hypothetical protein